MGNDLALLVQVVMLDLSGGNQPRSVEHEISGQFFFAHLSEMGGIRTIITAHNQQQVHWHIQQFSQRVLSLLRGTANGVEKSEILLGKLRSVAIDNGPS